MDGAGRRARGAPSSGRGGRRARTKTSIIPERIPPDGHVGPGRDVREEGDEGWAASDRDELVNLAPDSSRAPFYVAAGTTAGTDDE